MFQIFKKTQLYGAVPTREEDAGNGTTVGSSLNEGNIEMSLYSAHGGNGTLSKMPSITSSVLSENMFSQNNITIIANTMNALLGVSIFAMPWGYRQSGVLGGTALVIVICLLSFETARALLTSQRVLFERTGEVKTYPEIAQFTLGSPIWGSFVQMATLISCLGACVGYLIFLGETVGQLFQIGLSDAIYYVTPPIILLSWIRSFRNLAIFTIISVLSIVLAVFAIVYDGAVRMKGTVSDVPLFLPLQSTLRFLGPATFLFTVHYCVLSIGAETLHEKVDPVLEQANYTPHDLVDIVELGDVTVDYDHKGLELQNRTVRSSPSLERSHSSENDTLQIPKIPTLTAPLVVAYSLSALLIAMLGAGGSIVYRNAEIVRDNSGVMEPGCMDRVCQNVILNLSPGPLRAVVGVALIVSIMMSYIMMYIPAREHIELAVLKCLFPLTYHSPHDKTKNIVRAAIVLLTACAALALPYFGSVIGAVGGLTDALQSFVFPPLIFLKAEEGRMNFYQRTFYYGVFVWGLCTVIYTISNILWSFATLNR